MFLTSKGFTDHWSANTSSGTGLVPTEQYWTSMYRTRRTDEKLVTFTDTAKLDGPRTFTGKNWVGPVKLLCIIMFRISKIGPKSLFGLVKAPKFSQCLPSWCHMAPLLNTCTAHYASLSQCTHMQLPTCINHKVFANEQKWNHGNGRNYV